MMRCQPIRYGGSIAVSTIPAPILNLPLNDAGGSAVDLSGNGYNGTYNGTHTKNVALLGGNTGFEATASGASVTVPKNTQMNNAFSSKVYTASVVLKQNAVGGSVTPVVFASWNSANVGREVFIMAADRYFEDPPGTDSPYLRAGWDGGADNGNLTGAYDTSGSVVHLCYVSDFDNVYLYKNGVLVATNFLSGGGGVPVYSPDGTDYTIGGGSQFPGSYQFLGVISDMIVWDEALSASQVAALYAQNGRY